MASGFEGFFSKQFDGVFEFLPDDYGCERCWSAIDETKPKVLQAAYAEAFVSQSFNRLDSVHPLEAYSNQIEENILTDLYTCCNHIMMLNVSFHPYQIIA